MNNENKMKDLRVAAYDAELVLSKATAAAWHAASEYCGCAGNVYNASDKDAEENYNEVTLHTREVDWDSYLKAMDILSAAKDIAQKTKVITTIEYK